MSFVNIILCILVLLVLPVLLGNALLGFTKTGITLPKSFLFGYLSEWAVFQIISVPFILCKQSFLIVVGIAIVAYVAIAAYGIAKKYFVTKIVQMSDNAFAWVTAFFAFAAMAILVATTIVYQHTDADDSRFVVNAVDVLRTNRMLLTDVNTGQEITTFLGDLGKDVTSPWAVYVAFLSKLTGVYPTVMMHTVMPPILMVLVCIVYYLIAEELFTGEAAHKNIFICFVALLHAFGYFSVYTQATFTMIRLWQGKATVAAIGIPCLLWLFFRLHEKPAKANYLLILVANIALCLPSNMGILIAGLMLGIFGFVYGIQKKSWRLCLILWAFCIVNLAYIGLSSVIIYG